MLRHIRLGDAQRRGQRISHHRLGGESGTDQCGDRRRILGPHRAQPDQVIDVRHQRTVARTAAAAYLGAMSETPAFLDSLRPAVPDIVVPRGVTPFYLPRRPVRGRLIRLGPLADALLTRHDNHPAVTPPHRRGAGAGRRPRHGAEVPRLVQPAGEGRRPRADAAGRLHRHRRAARLRPRQRRRSSRHCCAATRRRGATSFWASGYLAFTVDQGPDRDRHQGIVTIEGDRLAEMALHYFRTSEQLRCFVHLACEETEAGWRAGALILEKIAGDGGVDPSLDADAQEESWRTADALAATLPMRNCWMTGSRRNGCCIGCSTPRASRSTARGHCPTAAAAPRQRLVRHPGRLSAGRPGPHDGRRRHRDDVRVLQFRLPLPARRRSADRGRRAQLTLAASAAACSARCCWPPRSRPAAAAAGAGGPESFEPLRYDYLTPLRLNVASIEVEQRFVPGGVPPDVSQDDPVPPAQALRAMAEDRLHSSRQRREGSLHYSGCFAGAPEGYLVGNLAVELDIYNTPTTRVAFAQAA